MANLEQDLQKAKKYCFSLLKLRMYSECEFRSKLKIKGFSPEIIEKTLVFLKEYRYVDDEEFAKEWIKTRLSRNYGSTRIRHELTQKGIPKETLNRLFKDAERDGYDQNEAVGKVILSLQKKIKESDPKKKKAKICGYLLRRGYPAEIVFEQLNA